jgi:peptidoglycan/LPS O-acetylase OafA/YrhL
MSSWRIPSLDGLRAFSIATVLLSHFSYSWHFPPWYANTGVRVFFVISGFLITTLLIREREKTGTICLKEFYLRRAYRIFPAAHVYIIVVSVWFYASLSPKDMVVAFTYLSSYFRQPGVFSHLWSLSVEEQFYLIWPAVMAISTASARRVALCVVVIDPVLRLILAGTRMGQGVNFYFPLLADSIATGCLLALFQPEIQKYRCFFTARWFGVIWALTFAIPLVPYLPHSARLYQCVGLPLLHIGIALCIQNAMLVRYRILNASVPVWIGVVSYSLYLWHVPFAEIPRHVWYTTFPTNISLAFVVAALSYYAVERPVLRFRDRRRQLESLQSSSSENTC